MLLRGTWATMKGSSVRVENYNKVVDLQLMKVTTRSILTSKLIPLPDGQIIPLLDQVLETKEMMMDSFDLEMSTTMDDDGYHNR